MKKRLFWVFSVLVLLVPPLSVSWGAPDLLEDIRQEQNKSRQQEQINDARQREQLEQLRRDQQLQETQRDLDRLKDQKLESLKPEQRQQLDELQRRVDQLK